MNCISLQNPYTVILQAIWSIIKEVAQSTANTLGIRRLTFVNPKSQHENNIIPDSGAANPLGLLHPDCDEGGVGMPKHVLYQSYFKIIQLPLVELLHLGGTELKLYIYLLDLVNRAELINDEWCWKPFNLHEVLGMSRKTFSRAMASLEERGLVETRKAAFMKKIDGVITFFSGSVDGRVEVAQEDCYQLNKAEKIIRDRLMSVIGGQPEVSTPVGRIDLLTDSEIIEVKRVADWKSAMRQVLAYASFYPQHIKRIHLFGKEAPTADTVAICKQMGIVVTFEEVGNAF